MTNNNLGISPSIRHLQITFNLPIYPRQIKNWRGAFIQMAGWENDLFHNHNNQDEQSIDKQKSKAVYHHRYPLIQYRVVKGQASILAINEGIEALQKILSDTDWRINWNGKELKLQVADLKMNEHYLRMSAIPKTYRLFNWLAFNEDNYQQWQKAPNYITRIQLLENIITGQLLGYAESMNWEVPEHINVEIQNVQQVKKVSLHGVPRMAFNLTYTCNVLLPEHIALGKGVSHGFGWQKTWKMQRERATQSSTMHKRKCQGEKRNLN